MFAANTYLLANIKGTSGGHASTHQPNDIGIRRHRSGHGMGGNPGESIARALFCILRGDFGLKNRQKMMLTEQQLQEFMTQHSLPGRFRSLIDNHYSRLATWVLQRRRPTETLKVGINGAQGTGKSTLAAYLQLALAAENNWRVVVLSIDDYYLPQQQRQRLGEDIHPLLATRGVPGTHDIEMLARHLEQLQHFDQASTLAMPRFDKALDERARKDTWPEISGPVDLIILEGWCVGSTPQPEAALLVPVNALERAYDASGTWRCYVNDQLGHRYADLFSQLDALIFLQAPNFDAIYRWRLEQEVKLAESTPDNSPGIMSSEQIAFFVQHFERISKADLQILPDTADAVVELDENHDCRRIRYSRPSTP